MNHLRNFIRVLYWRLRLLFGVGYGTQAELTYRVCRAPEPTAHSQRFPFNWGDVEYVSASDLRGQFGEIYCSRHYAADFQSRNPVIIDAGGNIGLSAIWFRQNYPQCRLIVFEADSTLAELLKRNLTATNISGVEVHAKALWVIKGEVAFDTRGRDKGAIAPTGQTRVPCVDIAEILPDHVDLLKLDIEGAEFDVIDRLCVSGKISQVENIVAEFHITRESFDRTLSSLNQLRSAGMQVAITSALGPWLGDAARSPFELVGKKQILADVFAWRTDAAS